MSNTILARAMNATLTSALVWSTLAPLQSHAQVAATADVTATLEEVVVTAQRRSEKVQDVPIAITALSSADLSARGVRQAGDIASAVPNLMLSLPYGEEAQPTFALRGVTTNDFSQNQSSPIAMYVDDVYKSVGAVQALQTYDLDRVEVLRGPQGTLYGKNATGGAISFYSKGPSLSEYDGYVTAGLSNYNGRSVNAAFGGPIVDEVLGWRAAVYANQRDGWVQSVVPGVEPLNSVDALAGRFSLLYKPSADLTALLKVSATKSGGTPYGARPLNNDPSVTGFSGQYGWFNSGAKYSIHKQLKNDSVSLKIDWQLADHYTVTSVTGFDYGQWYEKSDDGALATTDSGAAIHIDDPNTYASSVNSFSQELRIASHDTGKFGWLGGLYYGHDTTHANLTYHFFDSYSGFYTLPSGTALWGSDQYNNFDQVRVSKALFLNATYEIAPTVTFRAGVRYTKDDITINNFYALEGGLTNQPTSLGPDSYPTLWTPTISNNPSLSGVYYSPSFSAVGGVIPSFGRNDSNVSVKAGLDWKISTDMLAYLSFSQGYRGAAFNGQAFNGPAELTFANPEKLDAYEVGLKSELLQHRLEVNAAAFYYAYHDQQFLDTYCALQTTNGCGGTGFKTSNAPKSRVEGGEVEVHARPLSSLDVRASLGLLSTKYQELYLHFADRSGNKLIMAPAVSAGGAVDWRAVRLASGDLHLSADANYYAKQYFDALNSDRISQGGYGVANARMSFTANGAHHYAVAVWAKNLFNREYLAYGLAQRNPADGGLGFDYTLVGEPRTFGVEFTARY